MADPAMLSWWDTHEKIEQWIAAYLGDTDPRLDWVRAAVGRHKFLPLYLGWLAVLGIRPDGTFVRWDFEETPDTVVPLREAFLQRLAICEGAKELPWLRGLLPPRPVEAITCDPCGGSGIVSPKHPTLICECGGAGWLIPGEPRGISPG